MTEKEKMLAGKIYDPFEPELLKLRTSAHKLCRDYNLTCDKEEKKRKKIISKLLPNLGKNGYIQGPLYCDFGFNIKTGENFYANFNFTALDVCPINIGDNVFIGPNCAILTPLHPLRYGDRNPYLSSKGYMTDKEYGAPIAIGDNCWIAGNVTILAGAKIGEGCVIGAGSVVKGEIPPNSLAYGNPCRAVRQITEEDRLELKNNLF